jgi:GTPase SAR1 family protein
MAVDLKGQSTFTLTNISKSDRFLKMLVYGKPGAGKTTLLASAVDVKDMGDVLFLDAESGDMTIDGNPRIKNPGAIDHIRITSFGQIGAIHKFLMAHCRFRDLNDTENLRKLEAQMRGCKPEDIVTPKKWRTVIIDSLTEIQEYCMYQLLGVDQTVIAQDVNDVDVAQFAEFRKLNQMIQLLVRGFRDLPMNVLFATAEQYEKDEQSRFHYMPNLTGKLASQVQGFVDVVGYLMTGTLQEGQKALPRRLYVQPVGKFAAKNRRSGFQEAHLDNPTMSDVMKAFGLLGTK